MATVVSGSLISPGGAQGPSGQNAIGLPIGTVMLWCAGGSPPAGWLTCDGSTVSRTLYANLFGVIGTNFGSGDGSTTFGLPDLRGRVPVGAGQGSGLTNRALAAVGGEEAHQLTIAELASHTHPTTINYVVNAQWPAGIYNAAYVGAVGPNPTQPTGGDTPHNTMPPFLVLSYIIKASATGGATNQAPIADSTQAGLLNKLSGLATDYVGGDNACHDFGLVRARSFNAVGNPTFECDQRNVGTALNNVGNMALLDRWFLSRQTSTAMILNVQQTPGMVPVPGTSFYITQYYLRITLGGQQTTLAAGDWFAVQQQPEGWLIRELFGDVHSAQLLVRSSVGGLKFGFALQDQAVPPSRSLTKLCTIPSANAWTPIQLPSLPVWPSGGTWPSASGAGYYLVITLASGTTKTSPANDTWQNGNFIGAIGQSNFGAQPVNSTLDIAFVQHEPGPLCTTLIDCPFENNLRSAKRYYAKSLPYGVKFPDSTANYWSTLGQISGSSNTLVRANVQFEAEMAKLPSITLAAHDGTANAVFVDSAAYSVQSVSVPIATTKNIHQFAVASAQTAYAPVLGQWTADTGW